MNISKFVKEVGTRLFLRKLLKESKSIVMEIELLKVKLKEKVSDHNEKMLYSFLGNALVFGSYADLKSYQSDPENNSGLYQIRDIGIISIEKLIIYKPESFENDYKMDCIQTFGIIISKHYRDCNIEKGENPNVIKFRNIARKVIIPSEEIKFIDSQKCICGNDVSLFFVNDTDFEMHKDFIVCSMSDIKEEIAFIDGKNDLHLITDSN